MATASPKAAAPVAAPPKKFINPQHRPVGVMAEGGKKIYVQSYRDYGTKHQASDGIYIVEGDIFEAQVHPRGPLAPFPGVATDQVAPKAPAPPAANPAGGKQTPPAANAGGAGGAAGAGGNSGTGTPAAGGAAATGAGSTGAPAATGGTPPAGAPAGGSTGKPGPTKKS